MRNKISFFLLIVILFSSEFMSGQKKLVHTLTSQRYSIREGLAQIQTFRVFQDSYGYIWTVLNGGVSRFDGKNFHNYTLEDIGQERIITYINQYKESVFFVSVKGISFLHPDGGIAFYEMPDEYNVFGYGFPGEATLAMADKRLYIANCRKGNEKLSSERAFFIFDLEHKTFEVFCKKNNDEQLHVADNKLIVLKSGEESYLKIYEISGDTLTLLKEHTLDKEKKYYIQENISGDEFFLSETTADEKSSRVYSCFLFEDNIFEKNFICEVPYLARVTRRIDKDKFIVANVYDSYLIDGNQQHPFPINTVIVNYATKDRDGNLWLATEEGLINCYHLHFDSYKLGIRHNDYIWNVRKDLFDNTWFASYGVGFWRADKDENITKAKIYKNGREITLDLAYMDSAEDSLGRIYFTSNLGLAVFDPRKGNSANLTLYETGVSLAIYYDTITNCIYSGGITSHEDYWSTTLVRMNKKLETQIYPLLNTRHIICISRDSERRLRIGTHTIEYIFDEDNEVFTEDTVARPYRGVIAMELDRQGFLWKGTTSGVYAEDPQGNLLKIMETSQGANFLMCYDDRYIIWGFADKLAVLDLPAFHRDTTQVNIRIFDSYSGYDVLECGQNGDFIDKDGYAWVIGADKVLRFHPDKLMAKPEPKIATPYIAAVYNKDKDHDWTLVRHDSLIFENKNNNLRFDLLQASVMAADKLTFRYRLNGYSDYWVNTNERSFVFQNLPYGKFHFEVQSSLDGAEWSESALSQLITIKRPFWLTLPGLSLLSGGLLILLLSIVYWARKLSIKKQEEKRQIERLKYRAVQSKFIPHFTGNVLNSINYLISKDPELAQKYIVDFSEFSRQTLLYSEKLHRTLKEEFDYIELYLKLEKMRFEEDLDYSIYTDPAVDMGMKVPMMILQTFCENAMKHGLLNKAASGIIKVEALRNSEYVVLAVEDDGIGREKALDLQTEGSKEGLNIVNEQLKFFNKVNFGISYLKIIDLFDDNGSSSGTRFELHIPINNRD